VGGAFAGNQIERQVKSTKSYDITVRFDDGPSRTISETKPPPWRKGEPRESCLWHDPRKLNPIDPVERMKGARRA
jgi:hypothetical protein